MFKATREAIKQKAQQTLAEINKVSLQLGSLGKDGDLFDEPLMHQLHIQREQLDKKLITLNNHLISHTKLLSKRDIGILDRVNIGHEVELNIKYSDNGEEKLCVTTGTTLDHEFLSDSPLFNGETKILISNISPLGTAIMGARENQEVTYKAGNLSNRVKILKISSSPLLID